MPRFYNYKILTSKIRINILTIPNETYMKNFKDFYAIKLHDTDAAGILFFASQFKMAHDVYEKFLGQIGFPFIQRFKVKDFYIPIVHAEADYRQPLKVGDVVEVALEVANIGKSSFTLEFTLTDLDGITVGTARMVHVTIDPQTMKKIDLPGDFRAKLEEYL